MKRSFKIVAILLLLSLIFGCSSTDSKKKVTITTVEPGYIEAGGKAEHAQNRPCGHSGLRRHVGSIREAAACAPAQWPFACTVHVILLLPRA